MSLPAFSLFGRPAAFALPVPGGPSVSTPSCTKVPAESRMFAFRFGDFPELREQGQTLSGTPAIASDPTGPTLGSPFVVGDDVLCQVSAGTAATDYVLTVTVATSGGATLAGVGLLQVRSVP